MTNRIFCLLLFSACLPAAAATQEEGDAKDFKEVECEDLLQEEFCTVRGALEMIDRGEYEKALTIIRDLEPTEADIVQRDFTLALVALRVAETEADAERRERLVDEAIISLRRVLVFEPGVERARLELGRAYFYKGNDELAKSHFERVLASNPPEHVEEVVNHFMTSIRSRRNWTADYHFTVNTDTNLNNATDADTVYIPFQGGFLPVDLQDESRAKKGYSLNFGVSGEYIVPRFFKRDNATFRMGGFINRIDAERSSFDSDTVELFAGPRYYFSPVNNISVLGVTSARWIGGSTYSRSFGGRIETVSIPTNRFITRTTYSRMYLNLTNGEAARSSDGPSNSLDIRNIYSFTPTFRGILNLSLSRSKPHSLSSRSRGRSLTVGTSMQLPGGLSLTPQITWGLTRFEGINNLARNQARRDRNKSLSLNLRHDAFQYKGFSPTFSISHQKASSNNPLSNYSRNIFNFNFQQAL